MGSNPRPSSAGTVGVISDTHGLMRRVALDLLAGCGLIIHAGDVGSPQILETLRSIAPLVVVRGNTDRGDWAEDLPLTASVQIGESWVYVLHNIDLLDLDPAAAGFRCVISGHSHKPSIREMGGVLYLNPGSAGPRRFRLPVALALLHVHGPDLKAELIEMDA